MPKAPYLGELEHLLLLAILQLEDEAYTVSIRRVLAATAHRAVTRGALYTSLDRLEGRGLVTSRLGEPLAMRGGRPRRYFEVTARGLEALHSARAALANLSRGVEIPEAASLRSRRP